jgi:hypothetical protein
LADFDKLPHGKDQCSEAGMTVDGVYYSNTDLIKALAKALIVKGTITKAEIKAQLG